MKPNASLKSAKVNVRAIALPSRASDQSGCAASRASRSLLVSCGMGMAHLPCLSLAAPWPNARGDGRGPPQSQRSRLPPRRPGVVSRPHIRPRSGRGAAGARGQRNRQVEPAADRCRVAQSDCIQPVGVRAAGDRLRLRARRAGDGVRGRRGLVAPHLPRPVRPHDRGERDRRLRLPDPAPDPPPDSWLYLNGCTNFGANLWVSVSATSCSSRRPGGARASPVSSSPRAATRSRARTLDTPLTANEVRQIVTRTADDIDFESPGGAAGTPPTTAADRRLPRHHPVRDAGGLRPVHRLRPHQRPEAVNRVLAGDVPPEADIASPSLVRRRSIRSATAPSRSRAASPPSAAPATLSRPDRRTASSPSSATSSTSCPSARR